MDLERLKNKVQAVNNVHKYAHELYNQMEPIFRGLIGQKIDNQDGSLAKYAKLLPEILNTPELRAFCHGTMYSLQWSVTSTVNTEYATVDVTVGYKDRHGVLTEIAPRFAGRYDYTIKEVQKMFHRQEVIKKAFDKATADLMPFKS